VTVYGKSWTAGFFIVTAVSLSFFSCTSVPKTEKEDQEQLQERIPENTDSVELKVPDRKGGSFFRDIDPEILNEVVNGSPAALKKAAGDLRKASIDYTETEKVLLQVAARIMKIAWPTESLGWEPPAAEGKNAYLGALDSAEKGVYDSSTGNTDFLTLVLPSLVLLTNESRKDYYSDSEQALTLALNISPDSVLANYLLGVLYRQEGKSKDSLRYFEAAASNAPECLQTSLAWANSLRIAGQIQSASEIAERLVKRYPDTVSVLKICAETAFALGNYNSAELYVARVLQQNPSDSAYILFRARILVEKDDYIKAASLLDVYARTDTTSKEYLMLRARIQRDWNKNLSGAVETMNQAVSLYPNDADVLLFAAELSSDAGDKLNGKTSGELARSVLAKDPSNAAALGLSIKELVREKKWAEAYGASQQLIGKNNALEDSIYTHIKICLALAKNDEAWTLASSLYNRNPSDEQAVQAYLEVMYATGRKNECAELINTLLPGASSRMKSFLYYRRSFLANGEQNILGDLRSSLIANPRNEDSLYRLYTIYYNKHDYRKAQYYLKQVVALNPSNEEFLKKNTELENLLSR